MGDARRIELKICSPHQPVRIVSARLSGKIQALQSLWPSNPRKLIFNGHELLDAMTFESYGIRDGDSIVALPVDPNESVYRTNHWLSLTRDCESFNEALEWMLNPRTSLEAARLRDVHHLRAENMPRTFARWVAPLAGRGERSPATPSSRVDYAPPTEPAAEALPVPWKTD
jgi:hypothetical protein